MANEKQWICILAIALAFGLPASYLQGRDDGRRAVWNEFGKPTPVTISVGAPNTAALPAGQHIDGFQFICNTDGAWWPPPPKKKIEEPK